MKFYKESTFKIFVVFLVSCILFGALAAKVGGTSWTDVFSKKNRYHFYLQSGKGIIPSSTVYIMGVPTGQVESVGLKNSRVRVDIVLPQNVILTDKSYISIEPKGILGSQVIQIYIVMGENVKVLEDGGEITRIYDQKSLGEILSSANEVLDDVKEISSKVSKALLEGDEETVIGRIVQNLEQVTQTLDSLTRNQSGKVQEIISNLHTVSEGLRTTLGDPDMVSSIHSAVSSLDKVESILYKTDEVVAGIQSGRGSVGRLLTDEETVNNLNTTLTQASKLFGGASRVRTKLGYHFESLSGDDEAYFKHNVSVLIKPGWDREYLIGVVKDGNGTVGETVTIRNEDDMDTIISESKRDKSALRLTATFGKRFHNLVVRGGVIENSGGLGLDMYGYSDKIRLSVESSNFNQHYAKMYARYDFIKGVYVLGGLDDVFAEDDFDGRQKSSFIGLGVSLDDHDLKGLMGRFLL